jgi:hypothetical protein
MRTHENAETGKTCDAFTTEYYAIFIEYLQKNAAKLLWNPQGTDLRVSPILQKERRLRNMV